MRFALNAEFFQASAILQPLAFKTFPGDTLSSHLGYLADIFGALNHMKAFTGFEKIF